MWKRSPVCRMKDCRIRISARSDHEVIGMNFLQFMMANRQQVLDLTLEHMTLAGVAPLLAALVGIPLGILITRVPQLSKPVLGGANIIQTIPSLALFGFLLPAPWIGDRGSRLAILALALYALLPLIRNTYAGIRSVDPAVVEAGRAMGLAHRQLLFLGELPLGSGVIVAGMGNSAGVFPGFGTTSPAVGSRVLLVECVWLAIPL